jgi:hypothetical protein
LVFLKESFISNDFCRGACGTNGDLFYDVWLNVNVNFDCGGDVGHVSFFKSIEGRDRVFELVNMPR